MLAIDVGWMYNVSGALKIDKYLGILLNTVLPSMVDLFGDQMCIFQHDNDPKHLNCDKSFRFSNEAQIWEELKKDWKEVARHMRKV